MAASTSGHRKQILLFLAAVIIPCLALVIFGLQVIRQERELFEKRAAEERARRGQEIGQHLLVRLEKFKLEETQEAGARPENLDRFAYRNPEVTLVGLADDGRLLLPWEFSPAVQESRKALENGGFRQKIQEGEQAEFLLRDPARAAAVFRAAASAARGDIQRAYARLLLARALAKSGNKEDAVYLYRELIKLHSSVMDESGVPIYLYAAERFLSLQAGPLEVAERLRAAVDEKRWSAPVETSMLGSLLENLASAPASDAPAGKKAKESLADFSVYKRKLELVLALKENFREIALAFGRSGAGTGSEPVWMVDADGSRLLSLGGPFAERGRLLIVVDGPALLSSLYRDGGFSAAFPEEFRLEAAAGSRGVPLGPNYPGLKVLFPETQPGSSLTAWSFRRSFYLLAMALVIALTLFGAYLLWRDVRRDLRLAEMRSQFVSSVSHELKTPLTAIRMFAETLRLRRSGDPGARDEYLDTIVKESERLTRLLNNVLDFSKIEQGKKVYRPTPSSLDEIIRETARALEYPMKQQGFALKIECEEGLPEITVDHDALEQALMNLLSNAMKYSGESREISLKTAKKGPWAVIQVVDHGTGIDPAEQERIFEKFYRVASPENDRLPGTGLGLSLVAHFVRAHGGRVEVESAPGRGSIFSLYLPLEQKP